MAISSNINVYVRIVTTRAHWKHAAIRRCITNGVYYDSFIGIDDLRGVWIKNDHAPQQMRKSRFSVFYFNAYITLNPFLVRAWADLACALLEYCLATCFNKHRLRKIKWIFNVICKTITEPLVLHGYGRAISIVYIRREKRLNTRDTRSKRFSWQISFKLKSTVNFIM